MTDEIKVVLTGPAKIRGAYKRAGETGWVTEVEREQLRAAGVVLAVDDAAVELIENAEVAADLNATIIDWQARALSAEAQLKVLEARVLEIQGGPLPVAEDADGTSPIEDESVPVAEATAEEIAAMVAESIFTLKALADDMNTPQQGTKDSLEPTQGEDQAEVRPADEGGAQVEEDPEGATAAAKADELPEAATTAAKPRGGKAKG